MTGYDNSRWAERDFAHRYLDGADIMIMERRRMLEVLKSHYRYFLRGGKYNRVLDLGCGDGILTHELLNSDDSLSAILIDPSEDMLQKAKDRFAHVSGVQFIRSSFQELVSADLPLPFFNLAVSSLAIHHLDFHEKKRLFRYIYRHLADGGYFVNIDIVLSPTQSLEFWYRDLWREWMTEKCDALNLDDSFDCEHIIDLYGEKEHYAKIDTLDDQLNALKDAGFTDIDCFYKFGLFAVYGGIKPKRDQS